jgi:hypothetical protein
VLIILKTCYTARVQWKYSFSMNQAYLAFMKVVKQWTLKTLVWKTLDYNDHVAGYVL